MNISRHLWLICILTSCILTWVPGINTPGTCATYIDALERRVELPQVPQRVVSLVPSVTETIYALGAHTQLVGVTDFCTYPPAAQSKPRVGAYNNPSIEAIAMLEPDLVIIAADMATPATLDILLKLGLPVYTVYPRSIAATVTMLRNLGLVLGYAEAGETLAHQLESRVAQLRAEVEQEAASDLPRAMLTIMVEPLVVAGADTLPGELLACAGGINVAQQGNRYPMWNMETVLAQDPDIIIVSPHPGTSAPENFFLRFPQLRAVQHGTVIPVPADWLQRPGPRVLKGLNALRAAILNARATTRAINTEEQGDAEEN
ncbi:MAG: cobalamin-binding protein [Desulfuromonadaceae bacterium]|nr:cobalamin-binding protein [Desulfuromonadaceae bacterium]